MHQAEIMRKLQEASDLGVTARESRGKPRWAIPRDHPLFSILRELRQSRVHLEDAGKDELIDGLLKILYTDTVIYNPRDLPALFPFFALICSDRAADGSWPLIDWRQRGQPH